VREESIIAGAGCGALILMITLWLSLLGAAVWLITSTIVSVVQ